MAKKIKMNPIDWIAITLLVIGGLVHGGQAFYYYAVEELFISLPLIAQIIKGAVGLSAIYTIGRGFQALIYKLI